MDRLLFSIFYPHNQKCLLVRHGISPLLEKFDYKYLNFFFSAYKGESVTIYVNGDNRDKIEWFVKDHISSFFSKFKAEELKVQLPLNQLFLDFPYNNIHFWQKDPFIVTNKAFDVQEQAPYYNNLSKYCLKRLSSKNHWDDTSTFYLFTELLSTLKSYFWLKYEIDIVTVFDDLINSLKRRAGDKEYLIESFLQQGIDIYNQNRLEMNESFDSIRRLINDETGVMKDPINEWLEIINQKQQLFTSRVSQESISQTVKGLILDVGAKVDLSQKGLIQAVSAVSKMNKWSL